MYLFGKAFARGMYDGISAQMQYFPQLQTPLPLTTMQSTIKIDVTLDQGRMPEEISWSASESSVDVAKKAKGMILSFWDGTDKTALRIDLWTKDMMVDEMTDFFYQTLMSMADSYDRATHQPGLAKDMKRFAQEFYAKFQAEQKKTNKV